MAELAQLELTPQEVETYRGQLDAILTYIDKLNELDISEVEPMAQVLVQPAPNAGAASDAATSGPNPAARDDIEVPCHTAEAVLKVAPDPSGPYFRVPRVIER